jgi:hypothetical protein
LQRQDLNLLKLLRHATGPDHGVLALRRRSTGVRGHGLDRQELTVGRLDDWVMATLANLHHLERKKTDSGKISYNCFTHVVYQYSWGLMRIDRLK